MPVRRAPTSGMPNPPAGAGDVRAGRMAAVFTWGEDREWGSGSRDRPRHARGWLELSPPVVRQPTPSTRLLLVEVVEALRGIDGVGLVGERLVFGGGLGLLG